MSAPHTYPRTAQVRPPLPTCATGKILTPDLRSDR